MVGILVFIAIPLYFLMSFWPAYSNLTCFNDDAIVIGVYEIEWTRNTQKTELILKIFFSLEFTEFSAASKKKLEEVCQSLNRPADSELKLHYKNHLLLVQEKFLENSL